MNLDDFIQEMIRMSAGSLVLNSDRKGLLHLPSGNKFTKVPISHQQLSEILLRAAPEQYRPGIRVGKPPPAFRYLYQNEPFVVRVDALGGTWSIKVAWERTNAKRRLSLRTSTGGGPAAGEGDPQAEPGDERQELGLSWTGQDEPPWGDRSKGVVKEQGRPGKTGVRSVPSHAHAEAAPSIHPVVAMPAGKPPGVGTTASSTAPGELSEPSGGSPALGDAIAPLGGGFLSGEPLDQPSGAWLGPEPGSLSTDSPSSPHTLGTLGPEPVPAAGAIEASPFSRPMSPMQSAPGSEARATELASQSGRPPRIDGILRKLVTAQGSDLHLTSGQIPRCRIAGNIAPVPGEKPISASALQEMLFEIMPKRVQDEFTRTKDGDFAHAIEGLARFRVNVGVDRHGVFAVLRVIPNEIFTPEQIGLPKKVLDLCHLSKGMVLVTGPTGSGKSTTLATLIDIINSNREDHIITIEDPIEFVHPDNKKCLVHQREVGEHTGSFKRALKAALREDPDIVLVGEMRDLETIAIAIETAATGHLVFGTLHTSTAPSTVDRIIDQFPANQQEQIRVMLSDSLKGVIAQTLCKRIDGGRVAAFEILICNRAVANLIREGKTFQLYSTMQTTKAAGSMTLNESLLSLVKQKIISPEEAFIKAVNKDELKDAMARLGIRASLQTLEEY